MESFISLSPDVSGPPSPPISKPDSGITLSTTGNSLHGTNALTVNGNGGVPLTTTTTATTDDNIKREIQDGTEVENEDEVALRQAASVVEGLQQMDLLALVLDLMERVSSGAVTAKTVDNEV